MSPGETLTCIPGHPTKECTWSSRATGHNKEGYLAKRILSQCSMMGFDEMDKNTSTFLDECILNCRPIQKLSKSKHDTDPPDGNQEQARNL